MPAKASCLFSIRWNRLKTGQHSPPGWAKLPALLQFDTGMSRLGLSAKEFDRLLENVTLLSRIDIKFAISHLANGDEPGNAANARQLAKMTALLARLPKLPAALANSGGTFLGKTYYFDLARPGIALYGIDPERQHDFSDKVAHENKKPKHSILPVLTLSARVIQVRDVDKGATVGYGGTYVANGPMRIATIAVGYADGLFRSLSNKGAAFSAIRACPSSGAYRWIDHARRHLIAGGNAETRQPCGIDRPASAPRRRGAGLRHYPL